LTEVKQTTAAREPGDQGQEPQTNKGAGRNHEEEKEEDDLVEALAPLVSHVPARQVGPRASPEPEPETGTVDQQPIPSIGEQEVSSVESKLYHSCCEITSQNLNNNFRTTAVLFLRTEIGTPVGNSFCVGAMSNF